MQNIFPSSVPLNTDPTCLYLLFLLVVDFTTNYCVTKQVVTWESWLSTWMLFAHCFRKEFLMKKIKKSVIHFCSHILFKFFIFSVSLFKAISTIVAYLMLRQFVDKNNKGTPVYPAVWNSWQVSVNLKNQIENL